MVALLMTWPRSLESVSSDAAPTTSHRLGHGADFQLQIHALARVDRYGELFG